LERFVPWPSPYPDADRAGDFLDARKARLGDILEDIGTKSLKYLYDFGDGWEHAIKIERSINRSCLIEARGTAHPKTSVVPGGFGEFLRPSPIPATSAIAN
jgi:hypothetical protein